MSNADINELIARIENLPDSDVIKALASSDDYTLEAMVIYESEAKRRGIRSEAVRPIALQEAQRKKDKMAVARSFKGIGEKLYGMRAFHVDGSYQTTKWFVFLYLPIYPISSLRVRCGDKREISVVEVLPLDWRQAVDTYCFVVLSWAGVAMAIRLLERFSFPFRDFVSVGLLILPFLFLNIVRRRAKRATGRNEKGRTLPDQTL